jgi:methionine biosynthesis protein MetW
MSVKHFENARWAHEDQKICFRHEAALALIDQGKILDLGSGDGLFLSLLQQKGIEAEGLDLSEAGVAKTRAKGLVASLFDFNDPIPFENNSFDTVVMLDLLEHLYTPEALVKEAARVAKQYVIVGVPNFSSLPARLQTLLGRVPENNRPNKGHIYWFNYEVLVAMLAECGLMIDTNRSNTFFEQIPGIRSITRFLSTLLPNLFSLSFVVRARKV